MNIKNFLFHVQILAETRVILAEFFFKGKFSRIFSEKKKKTILVAKANLLNSTNVANHKNKKKGDITIEYFVSPQITKQ